MTEVDKAAGHREHAAALVIVLAFVVLVTALALAYLSRTTTDRAVAHSSFNKSKADQLAASAVDIVIGDLRQEIVNGSTATPVGSTIIYTPIVSGNILPAHSGNPPLVAGVDPIPNLVRISIRLDGIAAPGVASRASAVNSTTDNSANGRSISLARWNQHYLVPRHDTSITIDSTPISPLAPPVGPGDSTGFTPPDWVLVTRSGPASFSAWNPDLADTTKDAYATGRYAYALYDEGGLLDVNVAGYPVPSSTPATYFTDIGRKGVLAFADLTALPTSTASPAPTFPPSRVNSIVGWRNFATTQQPGSAFPDFSFTAATTTLYDQFVIGNTTGFMQLNAATWSKSGSNPNPRTDQAFVTRQQLLDFRSATGFSQNALQYMGVYSREAAASVPQWTPAVPDSINPNFQTLRVTAPFIRNDGVTSAPVGEPLVAKRFLLQRLNWLTYKGPSGPSAANPSGRSVADADMSILINRYGLTSSFLQQGTDANILKYFGLAWDTTNERWNYVGHNGSTGPIGSLFQLGSLTGTRDPDFFELLQAGILNSSIGDSASPDSSLPIVHQQSKMLHLLTIGANLIAQSRADSYPVRIACSVNVAGTPTTMEAVGSPRLPYLSSLAACPVAGTAATGGVNWLLVPNLWNPYRDTWDLTEANVSSTLTPGYLRPPVRIRANGTAQFGAITAAPSPAPSPSPLPTPVPTPSVFPSGAVTISNLTMALATATPRGRDGFLQASRMGTSDVSPTPSPFATTTSASPTSVAQWNNVPRPPRPDSSLQGNDNVVVLRLSVPGSAIPASTTTSARNPVLVLNSAFQIVLEYQSPNLTWYPYSTLQGNNAANTWISSNVYLTTNFSTYGYNPSPVPTPSPSPAAISPTVLSAGIPTPWTMLALAQAPTFIKSDPRSIRYNSTIGVLNLSAPPMSVVSAGVIGSAWPDPYTTVPPMAASFLSTPSPTPTPTPTPSPTPSPTPTATPNPPNPATLGDNAVAGNVANPYNEISGANWRPVMMNRAFRSVGEMGYAFRDQPFKTLDFSSASSPDAGLLDLFSANDYTDPSSMRAGVISLNTRQVPVVAAVLASTIQREQTPRATVAGLPSPAPALLTATFATSSANGIVSPSNTPVVNKAGLTGLIANQTGLGPSVPKTEREAIARALGETDQTRTWNLLIDVVAQSGRYPPNATSLSQFNVDGEQRYWVHVAIDRFTGQVIDRQIEVVNE